VIDVVNSTAAPFQNAPDPKKGVAGKVEHAIGMVTGALGAPDQIIDTAFAAITAPVAAVFPSLPAITLSGLHIGSPHTHTHPPSFIPPAPPVPLPSLGMMLGAGSVTVLIGGMPAARAGDIGLAITCGSLAPPFEVYTGSSNVFIGGARAARMGDITKHCNPTSSASLMEVALAAASIAAGAAAMSTGGGTAALAQAGADAAVMAVKALAGKDPGLPPGMGALIGPPVPNVLIGGFPCPGIGAMVTSAFKAGLKKGLGKLKNAIKSKLAARQANGCKGNGSHPVYLVSGENFDEYTDFASGGLFTWRRHYTSARGSQNGPLGFGWRHIYQCRLERRLHRATFTDWQGLSTEFPRFELGAGQTRRDGYVLHRLSRGHFRLTHRQDPALEFEGGEFDSVLALRRVVQGERRIDLEYDAQGRLAAGFESDRGKVVRRFEFRYSAAGRIQEVCEVDPAGQGGALARQPLVRARYQYSPQGDLLRAEDALAGAWSYRYDAFHRLTQQSDPRGYAYSYSYDASGRCTDASGQDGLWWCHIQYFPEKSLTRYTEGDNATYEYHYDGDGVITKIVDPYGGELLRQLDAEGRLVSEVDSGGRTMRWLYDADGAHFARVDRFGNLFPPELEQPKPPNPFARQPPNSSFGWLFEGNPTPGAGALLGAPPSSLDAIPAELQHYARGCFRTQSASLDPALLAQPGAVRIDRDALGRKIRETDVLGRTRRWHYDATGNVVSERDRDGSVSTRETTSWNLLGARRRPIGSTLQYEYSKLEQIVAITDPLGNQSRYEYDLKERLVRVHRHGQLREEYVYDVGDHFIEKRDGQGRVLFTNTIHENHFVAVRKLASGGEHRFDYDERGRIVEASTDQHRVVLQYGPAGLRLADLRDGLGVVHRAAGATSSTTKVLDRYELRRSAAKNSVVLDDPAGRQTRIERVQDGLLKRSCGNGSIELLQYNDQGRLEGRLCYRRDDTDRYHAWATRYGYSAEGDLLQIADSQDGTTSYEVDAAHRLVAERAANGRDYAFSLDVAGNLISKPGLAGVQLDAGNRLRSCQDETFTYDERNHLCERRSTNGTLTRYTYDSVDLLVRIERTWSEFAPWSPTLDSASNHGGPLASTPGARPLELSWQAGYDAMGRRLWTRWANQRRDFYWDGDRLAAELLPDGAFRIYQYASPEALTPLGFTEYPSLDAEPASGSSYYIFSNPVGVALRIEDEHGRSVWRARRVDPYGSADIESEAQLEYNLAWPGHYRDPETGLHYNRYRYYDPKLGRYLQCDPLGYEGSPLNLYAYCPNPLVDVDVLGLTAGHLRSPHPTTEEGAATANKEGTGEANTRPAPDVVTASGQRAAADGTKLGPSGKPMFHNSNSATRKQAVDGAKAQGSGRTVTDKANAKQSQHLHAVDQQGNRVSGPRKTHFNVRGDKPRSS
jgi:RHS repeat-associated protein